MGKRTRRIKALEAEVAQLRTQYGKLAATVARLMDDVEPSGESENLKHFWKDYERGKWHEFGVLKRGQFSSARELMHYLAVRFNDVPQKPCEKCGLQGHQTKSCHALENNLRFFKTALSIKKHYMRSKMPGATGRLVLDRFWSARDEGKWPELGQLDRSDFSSGRELLDHLALCYSATLKEPCSKCGMHGHTSALCEEIETHWQSFSQKIRRKCSRIRNESQEINALSRFWRAYDEGRWLQLGLLDRTKFASARQLLDHIAGASDAPACAACAACGLRGHTAEMCERIENEYALLWKCLRSQGEAQAPSAPTEASTPAWSTLEIAHF